MLIHLNAFQPLSPWATAMHLPFTWSETQKKALRVFPWQLDGIKNASKLARTTRSRQRQQGEAGARVPTET